MYILFVSAAISGFSGFAPVLMLGATSYIADTSGKEERAFRIGEAQSEVKKKKKHDDKAGPRPRG